LPAGSGRRSSRIPYGLLDRSWTDLRRCGALQPLEVPSRSLAAREDSRTVGAVAIISALLEGALRRLKPGRRTAGPQQDGTCWGADGPTVIPGAIVPPFRHPWPDLERPEDVADRKASRRPVVMRKDVGV